MEWQATQTFRISGTGFLNPLEDADWQCYHRPRSGRGRDHGSGRMSIWSLLPASKPRPNGR